MEYWETKFRNERKSTVEVMEDAGQTLLTLEPGQTKFVESKDTSTSYAAFDEVVFKENGEVRLHENRAWRFPNPNNLLMLTIINVDGANCEGFYLSGGVLVHCYRGIPRYVGVQYSDPVWAQVERVERRLVEHRVKDGDYIVKKNVLEDIRTMRSKKECKAVQDRLLAEATEKARAELRRQFPQREP